MLGDKSNLTVLANACLSLIDNLELNDFWVLAGLTERSFEEGDRSAPFRIEVENLESAGLSPLISKVMRAGINGNLLGYLQRQNPMDTFTRNKWKGQDLYFQPREGPPARVEVKQVWDCTLPKYYENMEYDFQKLEQVRAEGFSEDLFAVIIYLTLPNYDYPAGVWRGKDYKPRSSYLCDCGIATQFSKSAQRLIGNPVWPENGKPHARRLVPPSPESGGVISKLFGNDFQTKEPWQFDAAIHLRDAEIAVAIWQIP